MEQLRKNRHFGILIYFFIIFLLYNYTENTIRPIYFMYSKLDNYIPFVKEMVIPYISWYVYIVIALIYTGIYSKGHFYKLNCFMFVGMITCFFLYLQFPNGQNLRPYIANGDILLNIVKKLYEIDTPTNSAPSIHVLVSIGIHMTIIQCERITRLFKNLSLVTMILIIASTVMIKQHSILDVLYGVALSIVLYQLIYKIDYVQYLENRKKTFVSNINK